MHIILVILGLMVDVVVYTVMKCLLEAHDSNPARFDRECLLHLSSRMKMWELAAKVRVKLCCNTRSTMLLSIEILGILKTATKSRS